MSRFFSENLGLIVNDIMYQNAQLKLSLKSFSYCYD